MLVRVIQLKSNKDVLQDPQLLHQILLIQGIQLLSILRDVLALGPNCNGKNENGETPKSPSCLHTTQVINRDYRHAIVHPTWVIATDTFLHLEEELVDIKRQDIVGSIRSDAEEDTCSSVSSLNMISIATRLGEDEIREEAMDANPAKTATPVRDFLKPDYEHSLEAKLKENCNAAVIMELTPSSF